MKNAMNAIVLGLAALPLASCGLPFSIVNNQYKDDLGADESYFLLAKRTFKEALAEVSRETNTPLGFSIDHFDPMSS